MDSELLSPAVSIRRPKSQHFRYQRGTLMLRGNVWYGLYRVDKLVDGQIVRVRRCQRLGDQRDFPLKSQARHALDKIVDKVNGRWSRRPATITEFSERWAEEILSKRKKSMQKAAESHLKIHILPFLGHLDLGEIGVENQQRFVTHLTNKLGLTNPSRKLSYHTITNVLGTLSSMLTTAKNWGYIDEGMSFGRLALPGRGIPVEPRRFTTEEFRQIFAAAKNPWRTMFAIAAYAGLRGCEIMGLRWEDINLTRKTLTVCQSTYRGTIQSAKTKWSEATIPIPNKLCDLLAPLSRESGLLFVNRAGRPHTPDKIVKKRLRPILEQLGIPRAGFHAFRHMHATQLFELGVSPAVVQRQLRHSDARVTLAMYGHIVEGAHRSAVEKMALLLT